MNPKKSSSKKQNFHKLDYLCYNKIKLIPKSNIISKDALNNLDLIHFNNSIEVDCKIHSKFRKLNRNINQKPILSERIKRNYSNGNKKESGHGWLYNEKNKIYKINNTEMNSFNNLLNLNTIYLSPTSNGKSTNSNVKNFFDKTIIINNNNFQKYEKKFNDKNIKIIHTSTEILSNEDDQTYINSKPKENNSQLKTQYIDHSKKKNKNNLYLNLSDPSSNNYNFKSLKNLNKSKNKSILKENDSLKSELNKFLKENLNLKLRMATLEKNGQNNEQNNLYNNEPYLKNKSKKRLNYSFKKNLRIKSNDKFDEDTENELYTKTINTNKNNTNNIFDNDEKNDEKTNQIYNIYDSMKFKIKKKKFSFSKNSFNDINNNINCNNSINLNNGDINLNKVVLVKDSYNKIIKSSFSLKNSVENIKNSKNHSQSYNIRYNGAETNNINNINNKLQMENDHLTLSNESTDILNYRYGNNTYQNHESRQLTEKTDKLKKMEGKCNILTKDNIDLQQKYNTLYNTNEIMRKKNEIYLNSIEEQQKKLKEKDIIINNLEKEINNKYKKNEDELKNKLKHADDQISFYSSKLKNIEEELQELKTENDSLYKFKSNYNDNEIELIELQNKLKKLENINSKYESLKSNYDELTKKITN